MEKLYSVNEAAELLGFKAKTIRRWVDFRKIGHVRVGGAIRIPESELSRVVSEGTVPRHERREAVGAAP